MTLVFYCSVFFIWCNISGIRIDIRRLIIWNFHSFLPSCVPSVVQSRSCSLVKVRAVHCLHANIPVNLPDQIPYRPSPPCSLFCQNAGDARMISFCDFCYIHFNRLSLFCRNTGDALPALFGCGLSGDILSEKPTNNLYFLVRNLSRKIVMT